MPRRERWSIMGAILEAILEQRTEKGSDARVTHVATKANVPYDRMQTYLADMEKAGLVEPAHPMPRLTDKGVEFVRHYRQWREVLERFGIAAPGDR